MRITGAAYYPEHWPEIRWSQDVELMKEMNFNTVRIGEFSWSVVEREEGKIDFSLFDRALNVIASAGLKVILGTPTASPPVWLVKKSPDILQRDEHGHLRLHGSRKHYCFNSELYRHHSRIITEAFARHYGNDDRIIAWQIDNEYGCHGTTVCFCENCAKDFRKWLRRKYSTLDRLNCSLGTVFWSQTYTNWDQIDPPMKTVASVNPHLLLEYMRFSSDSVLSYHVEQATLVRRFSAKPITHNMMVNFTDIDYRKLSKHVDFVSWDNYSPGEYDHLLQGMNNDLMRSLKDTGFVVMEQQPGIVNWQRVNAYYEPEHLGYWIKQAFAYGAFGSLVFRFRQLPYGAEQYHGGLVGYSGKITPRAIPASRAFEAVNSKPLEKRKKEIGIYIDYENFWINRIDGINNDFRLLEDGIFPIYRAIRELGYNVDFVFSDSDLDPFSTVIVPTAFFLNESFARRLLDFGGKVLVTAHTGVKDENNTICEDIPSIIHERLGIIVKDFGGLRKAIPVVLNNTVLEGNFIVDLVELRGAKQLAAFPEQPFEGCSALSEKKGWYFLATVPETQLASMVFQAMGLQKRDFEGAEPVHLQNGLVLLNPFRNRLEVNAAGERLIIPPYDWVILRDD